MRKIYRNDVNERIRKKMVNCHFIVKKIIGLCCTIVSRCGSTVSNYISNMRNEMRYATDKTVMTYEFIISQEVIYAEAYLSSLIMTE